MTDKPAPSTGRKGKLRVPKPFEDAIAAALETPPEPEESKPFGKWPRLKPDKQVRSTKK